MKGQNDVSKRHEEAGSQSLNDIRKEVLFYNDIFTNPLEKSFFVYSRKIEKIVTALYLVTDVMDSELPLTRSLRSESLDLLNACYQILTGTGKLAPTEMTRILVRLEHVTSLISIGRISHHISEMNAQVLVVELQKVTQLIALDTQELTQKYTSYLYPRNHGVEAAQPVVSHATLDDVSFEELEKAKKRQTIPNRQVNDVKATLTTFSSESKKSVENKKDSVSTVQVIKTTSRISGGDPDRKQSILNVIRSHKNASMQDIQKFVTGCSDKTLQRELVSLIASGQIRKIGDKRWATYHVV
jgi:hypothetical protein